MNDLIVELNQKEAETIYGGAKYVWIYIEGVKTLVLINS